MAELSKAYYSLSLSAALNYMEMLNLCFSSEYCTHAPDRKEKQSLCQPSSMLVLQEVIVKNTNYSDVR